jgi:hypothetical protein
MTPSTADEKRAFKIAIKNQCAFILQQRINALGAAMQSAQESANNDDKSSAGDKYEVGRAMGHLQQEMLAKQLDDATGELALVNSLNPEVFCTTVSKGAAVICNGLFFFVAIGLGNVVVNNQKVIVLSPIAPLAALMLDKRAGDSFSFNKNEVKILDVF